MPGTYVSAIIRTLQTGRYPLQLRDYGAPTWNGVFSLPGGAVEKGETPSEAMFREIVEETDLLDRASPEELTYSKMAEYDWENDLHRIIDEIERAYPDIPSFSGGGGGLDRHEMEKLLEGRVSYSFFFQMRDEVVEGLELREGRMSRLYSPEECMALVIAADDRLSLLHHFAQKGLRFR